MALKGSAKIELVNADGTKEVVEHGNMITNAVNDLMYAARGEQSNIMRICNNGDSFVEQMFGGILLFKHTLTDDPDDYYISSVNTVGYANLGAYGGLDIERGGYNASESGLQADGSYKLVWDFATSQANGTIQSIALCPNMMGKIGMSNSAVSSEKVVARTLRPSIAPFDTNDNLLPRSGNTNGLSNYGYNIFAVIGNIAYALHSDNLNCESSKGVKNNGGVLKIYRFVVSESGVSLRSKVGSALYIDSIDVQLPTEYVSQLMSTNPSIDYAYIGEEKKLVLNRCRYSGERLAPNASIKYVEIDLLNGMGVSLKTFTNTTNGSIYFLGSCNPAYSEYGAYGFMFVTKDYIVAKAEVTTDTTVHKLYVVRKSDNTDIKEVKFENGKEFTITANVSSYHIKPVFSFGDIFVFGLTNGSQYTSFVSAYVLDMSKGILKEMNASEMTYRANIPLDNKVTWGKTGTYLALSVSVNPFVLTTKNNLDAPVTKTASQTMKITYTLTEV